MKTFFDDDPQPERDPIGKITIIPRDYQLEAIIAIQKLFESFRGAMARMATGTGKTPLACFITEWWLSLGLDRRVMVVSYERQLVYQFGREIMDILRIEPGTEMGKEHVSKDAIDSGRTKIVVASRQTLMDRVILDEEGNETVASRLHKFDNQLKWLTVFDEVHRYHEDHVTCRNILNWFDQGPYSRRLGLTATSERGDGKTLDYICPAIAIDYPLFNFDGRCAVRDGWCVPYDQRFVVAEGVDFKNLREVKGDFDETELEEILNHEEQLGKLIVPTMELVQDRRTLIFSPTVNMARNVARFINARYGENKARSLDGSIPDLVRRDAYEDHKNGRFQFLSVCGLCREGYNDPGIQAIAVYRPTKSKVLAEQMKGRGCRTLKGLVDGLPTPEERVAAIKASIKPNAMIIDMVGITGLGDTITTAHIVGKDKPQEVIDLANRNMLSAMKEGRVVMPGQEIDKAQKQIEAEEREAMRQARIERDGQEQEEAKRRAKIQMGVQYNQRVVEQGDVGQRRLPKSKAMRFSGGKFKGKLITETPTWYLEMVLEKWKWMKWKFRDAVAKEFADRKPQLIEPWQIRELRKKRIPFSSTMTRWEALKLMNSGPQREPGCDDE